MEINKIYLGDCLELMQQIPAKSIDMILCDLPYGTTACSWDTVIPFDKLWQQYERIIKDRGAIALTSTFPFTGELYASNRKLFKYELIWLKNVATGFANANRKPMAKHENVLLFYKKAPVYNPQFEEGEPYVQKRKPKNDFGEFLSPTSQRIDTVNEGKRYPTSQLVFKRETGHHPTQKPVPLFEYLIKTYTNEGETVLDNCIGSGTTAVAAINTGRNFIGMEMEQKYFDIANQRIEKALAAKSEIAQPEIIQGEVFIPEINYK